MLGTTANYTKKKNMTKSELKEHEGYANIAIPYEVRNKLKAFCAIRGLSIKDMAALAIEQFIKQENKNGTTNE